MTTAAHQIQVRALIPARTRRALKAVERIATRASELDGDRAVQLRDLLAQVSDCLPNGLKAVTVRPKYGRTGGTGKLTIRFEVS